MDDTLSSYFARARCGGLNAEEKRKRDREYNRKSYLKHRDKRLADMKEYQKNNRERINATSLRWNKANPEYIKARTSLKGKIIFNLVNPRSNICSKCGKKYPDELTRQTCMHHEQYDESDPLAHTIELCHSCHGKLHAEINYPNGPHYKKGSPEYYQKHRERLLASQHRYNEKNRGSNNQRAHEYYQNNRGFILARSQAIRDSIKEAYAMKPYS